MGRAFRLRRRTSPSAEEATCQHMCPCMNRSDSVRSAESMSGEDQSFIYCRASWCNCPRFLFSLERLGRHQVFPPFISYRNFSQGRSEERPANQKRHRSASHCHVWSDIVSSGARSQTKSLTYCNTNGLRTQKVVFFHVEYRNRLTIRPVVLEMHQIPERVQHNLGEYHGHRSGKHER